MREVIIVVQYRKMSNNIQKIVLIIEPALGTHERPSKIGNVFMNRFAIDEGAKNEILKIYQLKGPFYDFSWGLLTFEEGLDLINYRIASDS